MKTRIYNVANFFALNILFFALYLNFIQKKQKTISPATVATEFQQTKIISTIPVTNPDQYIIEREMLANKTKTFEPLFEKSISGL